MENIIAVVQPDKLREQIAELNEKAAAPDLWDDPSAAQAVTSALSHRQSELDRITQMSERIDDLEAMVDMAAEDPDEGADILAEAEADLEKLRKDLGDLEIHAAGRRVRRAQRRHHDPKRRGRRGRRGLR